MAGVNKVILVGNLGADPEIRHLQNDVSVANFNLATTEYFKDKQSGERREITEWHRITAWRWHAKTAEKYLRKGSKVYVEGKLRTRQYQDKDGQQKYITEILVDDLNMLDRPSADGPPAPLYAASMPPQQSQQGLPHQQQNQPQPSEPITHDDGDDDLPF